MYNILCNSVISENFVKPEEKEKALAYWKEMMPFAKIKAVRSIQGIFNSNNVNKEKRNCK